MRLARGPGPQSVRRGPSWWGAQGRDRWGTGVGDGCVWGPPSASCSFNCPGRHRAHVMKEKPREGSASCSPPRAAAASGNSTPLDPPARASPGHTPVCKMATAMRKSGKQNKPQPPGRTKYDHGLELPTSPLVLKTGWAPADRSRDQSRPLEIRLREGWGPREGQGAAVGLSGDVCHTDATQMPRSRVTRGHAGRAAQTEPPSHPLTSAGAFRTMYGSGLSHRALHSVVWRKNGLSEEETCF